MVQRTVTVYTDDLTGTEGEDIATHIFSLDGVNYEVDLNPDSYQKLLDALGRSSRWAARQVAAHVVGAERSRLRGRTP